MYFDTKNYLKSNHYHMFKYVTTISSIFLATQTLKTYFWVFLFFKKKLKIKTKIVENKTKIVENKTYQYNRARTMNIVGNLFQNQRVQVQ
jgi:hypothetical protein